MTDHIDTTPARAVAPAAGAPASSLRPRVARGSSEHVARRRGRGWARGAALLVVSLVGAGALLTASGRPAFGLQAFTVMSGSMEPAIRTGDLIVAEHIALLDARPGDVVTFVDPLNRGRLITHRVRRAQASGTRSPSSPRATPTTPSNAGACPTAGT